MTDREQIGGVIIPEFRGGFNALPHLFATTAREFESARNVLLAAHCVFGIADNLEAVAIRCALA